MLPSHELSQVSRIFDLAMKIEQWNIDRPQPYARNARKISELAIEKVARSIKEFGWRQPIVVGRGHRWPHAAPGGEEHGREEGPGLRCR